jgi:uncharacterized membrane protein YfcA
LLGGGGSILAVPVLHYVLHFEMKEAVAMSLVVVGLTSLFGAVTHVREGNVNWRTALAFGPPAIVGARLGTDLAMRVSATLMLTVFGVVMLIAAGSMYLGRGVRSRHPNEPPSTRSRYPLIVVFGAMVGALTGFVAVGGGFAYVPALVLLGGLEMKEAVGTSLVLIALSSATSLVSYVGRVPMQWPAIAAFTALAFVGVAIGTALVSHVSQLGLRRGFAFFLLVMGVLVLFRR